MQKTRWILAVLAIVGLAGLMSVAQDSAVPGVSDTEIKIGGFIAQSGPVAGIGIPVARGAQAWYNWVNDTLGGVHGRKINFIVCDDAFDPARAVACFKRLVEEDQVFAIVHPLGTITIASVFQDMVASGIPVVSPHANATFLSIPTQPNVFAIQPNNVTFATVLARYAIQDLQAQKIAVVYSDDAFGSELKDAFVAELSANGIEPVATLAHATAETDFSALALRLRQADPEVVALLTLLQPTAAIILAANDIGLKPRWMATNTATDPALFALLGDASLADGLIASTAWPRCNSGTS
jgi:branched-chain amino acid transport system substrate-binding protein